MRTDGSHYEGAGPRRGREPEKPNHILLLTVLNPQYPITIDVIESVCKLYGEVQRIVIFRKKGVQAMVEFRNTQTASRAKEGLQGADIYSGCCTLRVEFGKAEKLNVNRNGVDMWDFTIEEENRSFGAAPSRPALLGDRPTQDYSSYRGGYESGMGGGMRGGIDASMRGGSVRGGGMDSIMRGGMPDRMMDRMETADRLYDAMGISRGMDDRMGVDRMGPGSGGMSRLAGRLSNPGYESHDRYGMGSSGGNMSMRDGGIGHDRYQGGSMGRSVLIDDIGQQQVSQNGPVLMVYGLNKEKMNADYLFNLFCLYGNVSKVKFLKTKEGCAMVEMADGLSVKRIMTHLNNHPGSLETYFDSKMTLGYSKQEYLAEVQMPYELPDGSPSFKVFIGSKNNRFLRPDAVQKTRFLPPSKSLHFFNTPPGVQEEQIIQVFMDLGLTPPRKVTQLPAKSEKSSRGQMEFSNITEALEAIVAANHAPISTDDNNSRYPFIMKLAFSASKHY